jgi:hypothetical protein
MDAFCQILKKVFASSIIQFIQPNSPFLGYFIENDVNNLRDVTTLFLILNRISTIYIVKIRATDLYMGIFTMASAHNVLVK